MELRKATAPLCGTIRVPGDKSISHRAVMLGSLAADTTRIRGFLPGADCLSTINCFRAMGIEIEHSSDEVRIQGAGLYGLRQPTGDLDCGNSGTTARLIAGILAGQGFATRLIGDESLSRRPMRRIMEPLHEMGASVTPDPSAHAEEHFKETGDTLPLLITPSRLCGIKYLSPVASAQVKSCVLLAGLYADGATTVIEPAPSRDHTERMLRAFGATVETASSGSAHISSSSHAEQHMIRVLPAPQLTACEIDIPGDISSATYWIAAALLVPGSELRIEHVGINQTRDGILDVVRAMGGNIELENEHLSGGEPVADLIVRHSELHGCEISGSLIPRLIDEIPVIAVLAAAAEGTTVIRDAAELRVKESDRITVVTNALTAMGADVTASEDGMIIRGGTPLHGAVIDPALDHRIAMACSVAALTADTKTEIRNADCVRISYPSFYEDLRGLMRS